MMISRGRFDLQALQSVDPRSTVFPSWFLTGGAKIGFARRVFAQLPHAKPRLESGLR
jgi:hypothetical protein